MKRQGTGAVAAALAVVSLIPAAFAADVQPAPRATGPSQYLAPTPTSDWVITLGAEARAIPRYEGADSMKFWPFPVFPRPQSRHAGAIPQSPRRRQHRHSRRRTGQVRADGQGASRPQGERRQRSSRARRYRLGVRGRRLRRILAGPMAAHPRRSAPGFRRPSRRGGRHHRRCRGSASIRNSRSPPGRA